MSPDDDDLSIPAFLRREAKPEIKDQKPMVQSTNTAVAPRGPRKPRVMVTVTPKAAKSVKAASKPAKAVKTMPKRQVKAPIDAYGYRDGSLKSRAAALYAKGKGATLAEVKEALGSVQLNVLTDLEGRGYEIRRTKEDGTGSRQVTRYKLMTKKP